MTEFAQKLAAVSDEGAASNTVIKIDVGYGEIISCSLSNAVKTKCLEVLKATALLRDIVTAAGSHTSTSVPAPAVGGTGIMKSFPLQQHALDHYRELLDTHRYDITPLALKVYSYEGAHTGKRRFFVSTEDEFLKMYLNTPKKHVYEIIVEDAPCRLYFDLEYNIPANQQLHAVASAGADLAGGSDPSGSSSNSSGTGAMRLHSLVALLIASIKSKLAAVFGIYIGDSEFNLLDSSTDTKFSQHLVVVIPRSSRCKHRLRTASADGVDSPPPSTNSSKTVSVCYCRKCKSDVVGAPKRRTWGSVDKDPADRRELLFRTNREAGRFVESLIYDMTVHSDSNTCSGSGTYGAGPALEINPGFERMWVHTAPSASNSRGAGTVESESEARTGHGTVAANGAQGVQDVRCPPKSEKVCFIDRGVYSRNRAFRLLLSSKYKKVSVLSVPRIQPPTATATATATAMPTTGGDPGSMPDRINARLAMSQVVTPLSPTGRAGDWRPGRSRTKPQSPPLRELYAHMLRETYVVPYPQSQWTGHRDREAFSSSPGEAEQKRRAVALATPTLRPGEEIPSSVALSETVGTWEGGSSDLLVVPDEFCHALQNQVGKHTGRPFRKSGGSNGRAIDSQAPQSHQTAGGGVTGILCSSSNCVQLHSFGTASASAGAGPTLATTNLLDRRYFFVAADSNAGDSSYGYQCREGYRQFMQCPSSHFPRLDEFIVGYARKGGVQGSVKSWTFLYNSTPTGGGAGARAVAAVDPGGGAGIHPTPGVTDTPPYTFKMRYQIVNNRYCENINRPHKSNHIAYEVNLSRGVVHQFCWDPDCSGFKSRPVTVPENHLPPEIGFLHPLSFELQCYNACV